MRFLFAFLVACTTSAASSVFAQSIQIDKSFHSHGVPGVQINETNEIGYEFVYLYKLVNMGGKLGLCGAVISNKWDLRQRKAVGVTVAEIGGVKLKRGLNYMPNYEGTRRTFKDPYMSYIGNLYVWSLDPAMALGQQAKCRKMSPTWTDNLNGAKVNFELPKTVYIQKRI